MPWFFQSYLNELAFGNANHTDLWNALSRQAASDGKTNINVAEIMDTWVLQVCNFEG